MKDRVSRLITASRLEKDACILIHKPSNLFYLSGYTGEGLILIAHGIQAIVTDFRYVEQAQAQAPGFSVHVISNDMNHAQVAASLIRQAGCRAALYEDDHLTVRASIQLKESLGSVIMEPLRNAPESLRQVKDGHEIELIERACRISCEAYEYICGVIQPGMSETDIRLKLDFKLMELGAQTLAFDTIVASGPNGSLPHAIPGGRKVGYGDMITLDFGAKYGGYCADMTRTIALGKADDRMLRIYSIVLETQIACQDALAPGKGYREVDAIAREMIGAAGYGDRFGHGLGHALGIDIHEEPRLNQKCADVMEPGHVVTVEPGIYLPGVGGVRIENSCVITQTGARPLVTSPRELRIL